MSYGSNPHARAGVREGDLLAGKYRVERVLGAGGMGVIVAAYHEHLQEKVALKFLLPEMLADESALARFLREARAVAKIKSEHVARVSDVGTLENGAPYIVMEYLEGDDLGAWLRQRGPLSIQDAVDFVLQACEAIGEAHGLGIVHRDLKPANLFCTRRPDGQPAIKVLDFGISKMAGQPGSLVGDVTKTTAIMGSPFYMSPEQLKSSRDVDLRTDIWALGIILYELVTGRVPFPGDSITEIAIHVATRPAPPLRDALPNASPAFEAVIARCLEKDREARYRRIAELGKALAPFGSRRALGSIERIAGLAERAETLPAPPGSVPPRDSTLPHFASETGAPVGRTMDAGPPTPTAAPRTGVRHARWLAVTAATFVCGSVAFGSDLWLTRHEALPSQPDVGHDPSGRRASEGSVVPPPALSGSAPPLRLSGVAPPLGPAASATPPAFSARAAASDSVGNGESTQSPSDSGVPALGSQGGHYELGAGVGSALGAGSGGTPTAASQAPPILRPYVNPAALATATPIKHVDCSIPFTIDSHGHRVPKPECL